MVDVVDVGMMARMGCARRRMRFSSGGAVMRTGMQTEPLARRAEHEGECPEEGTDTGGKRALHDRQGTESQGARIMV